MAGLKRGAGAKVSTPTNVKTGVHITGIPTGSKAPTGGQAVQPQGRTGIGKMPPQGSGPGMPGHA